MYRGFVYRAYIQGPYIYCGKQIIQKSSGTRRQKIRLPGVGRSPDPQLGWSWKVHLGLHFFFAFRMCFLRFSGLGRYPIF